ncbi:Gmad2 immunoglobulin-like domain-containing protein [Kribbella deserti]|uniref:Gmad2 immunoglobulin-like domain-containing protein n=1 Tax=Kribbella deserti TaxID=1926257 RepID=A0ABV6QDS4_9ACTN
MTEPRNEFDDLMRRALRAEADQVQPSDDGLHQIRERLARQPRPVVAARSIRRHPWLLTAGGAVLGTAATIGLFTVLMDRPPGDLEASVPESVATSPTPKQTRVAPTTPAVTPRPSPAPTLSTTIGPEVSPEPTETRAVPVYWVGDTVGIENVGPKLYRTFVPIKGRAAYEAVLAMTASKADDPDYRSPWFGAKVNAVQVGSKVITVDFAELPRTKLDKDYAELALQQLVYTVQGTLQSQAPVKITHNGRDVRTVFGAANALTPIRRAPLMEVQAFVWINSPTNGVKTTSPLQVTGIASAFEATVNWQVRNLKTRAVVQTGFTNTAEGQKHSPYAFTVKLPAGEYELLVYQESGEDGSITNADSKTFSVAR